jgi:hypothetical protein
MNRNKNVESSQSKAERAYESLMKRREYQKKFQQNRRERLLDPKINSEEEINDYKEKMAEARLRSKNKKKRKRQHQISTALTPLSPQSAEPEEEAPPTEPPVAAASVEKEECDRLILDESESSELNLLYDSALSSEVQILQSKKYIYEQILLNGLGLMEKSLLRKCLHNFFLCKRNDIYF